MCGGGSPQPMQPAVDTSAQVAQAKRDADMAAPFQKKKAMSLLSRQSFGTPDNLTAPATSAGKPTLGS